MVFFAELEALLQPKGSCPDFHDMSEKLSSSQVQVQQMSASLPQSNGSQLNSHMVRQEQLELTAGTQGSKGGTSNGAVNSSNLKVPSSGSSLLPNFSKVPLNKINMTPSFSTVYMDDKGPSGSVEMFEPVVVNLEDIEEQIVLKAR